jgi:hypothetical protein
LGGLAVQAFTEHVSPDNVGLVVREGNVLLLAVNNHPTRALVDRHTAGLSGVTLISGATTRRTATSSLSAGLDGVRVDGHLVEIHPEIGPGSQLRCQPRGGIRHQRGLDVLADLPGVPHTIRLLAAGDDSRPARSNTRWLDRGRTSILPKVSRAPRVPGRVRQHVPGQSALRVRAAGRSPPRRSPPAQSRPTARHVPVAISRR